MVSDPPSVSIGVSVMPPASRGTRIIDMSSCRSPGPVRHTIRMWLALWAYEHHILAPSSTHSPLSRRARVLSAATSEPASGSDIAIAKRPPTCAKCSRFCSSLPKRLSAPTTISVTP